MKTSKNVQTHIHSGQGISWIQILIITGICLAVLTVSPVLAGTKYLAGEPELSVSISGSNEFAPGTTLPITLLIQNKGLNTIKMVQTGIIDRDDAPNMAKMATVTLKSDDAPILIKSDSQMIGDIAGSESVPATFQIRIKDDAQAGEYRLPVRLEYTYLNTAEQDGTDSITYRYKKEDINCELPIIIKSAINLDIVSVDAADVNAGGEGFVTLTLRNTGTDTGHKSYAELNHIEKSPVQPVEGTAYIGDFNPGAQETITFRVAVSKDAEPQDYPAEVIVRYDNNDGEEMQTPAETFGIPVGGKIDFEVVSDPDTITAGEKKVIEVTYKNVGEATAYSAEARISAVDPFTSSDDLAFLNDILPGETVVASFELDAGSEANEKIYGLDSEIRYRDALDTSQISDTVKIEIEVTKPNPVTSLITNPIVILLILVGILGGGYYLKKNGLGRKQA